MDELLGMVIAFLPRLREAGKEVEARDVLRSLTEGCNPPEVVVALQMALADLPENLGPELEAERKKLLDASSSLLESFKHPEPPVP